MSIRCPFSDLREVLLGLGFVMTVLPTGHLRFTQPEARVRLYLPAFTEDEFVDEATLLGVAVNLDERGILPRDRFEDLLRQRSLAG